mmetsp:Transcript_24744/g.36293  ORF Transcript_24744/g.36293 Transcript_24744/m.36293 type:complete len:276 (+) Transcript_24744:72-899(+)
MEHCNEEYKTRRTRVLLGITGSVAAVKGPEIAVRLSKEVGADVRVLLTRAGENFWNKAKEYDPVSWQQFTKIRDDTVKATQSDGFSRNDDCSDHAQNSEKEKGKKKVCDIVDNDKNCLGDGEIIVHTANDEWKGWDRLGDPVLHIDLRNWADIILIAPLSAHTLAKLAVGMCDDTLSCCVRAWDFGHGVRPGKPLILCPAMNTAMWVHPITRSQLNLICDFSNNGAMTRGGKSQVHVVEPQEKTLACGEVGTGALAEVSKIIQVTKEYLEIYKTT